MTETGQRSGLHAAQARTSQMSTYIVKREAHRVAFACLVYLVCLVEPD
jgi:hypothetical protein